MARCRVGAMLKMVIRVSIVIFHARTRADKAQLTTHMTGAGPPTGAHLQAVIVASLVLLS